VKRKCAPATYHLMGRAPNTGQSFHSLSRHRSHDGSFQGNRLPTLQKNTRKAGHTGERWSVSHRWSVCAIEKKVTFTGQVCFHKSSFPCTTGLIEIVDAKIFKVRPTVKIKNMMENAPCERNKTHMKNHKNSKYTTMGLRSRGT